MQFFSSIMNKQHWIFKASMGQLSTLITMPVTVTTNTDDKIRTWHYTKTVSKVSDKRVLISTVFWIIMYKLITSWEIWIHYFILNIQISNLLLINIQQMLILAQYNCIIDGLHKTKSLDHLLFKCYTFKIKNFFCWNC